MVICKDGKITRQPITVCENQLIFLLYYSVHIYEPVKARPHATLLPNMGTCSRDIWLQQASFPTKASTGVWKKHKTAKWSRKQASKMNVFGKLRNKSVWSSEGRIQQWTSDLLRKKSAFTIFLNRLVNNYSLFIIRVVRVSVYPNSQWARDHPRNTTWDDNIMWDDLTWY